MFHRSGDKVTVRYIEGTGKVLHRRATILALQADTFEREYSWERGCYRYSVLYDDGSQENWVDARNIAA